MHNEPNTFSFLLAKKTESIWRMYNHWEVAKRIRSVIHGEAMCITKIKKSQLKIENSVTWMLGCIILILMSIFPNVVVWISEKLGFVAPVNFIFLVMIAFLLMQIFIDNIHITSLNEKIKDLDHYIALKEKEEKYSNK